MSTNVPGPDILFIDDNTEELGPLSQAVKHAGAISSKVLFPSEVDISSLDAADLVLVDFTLDAWIDEVETNEISLRPLNGIALAAVLRQHAEREKEFPPTGFSLITGIPTNLGPLPAEQRPHVISRLNNVEWFFEKRTGDADTTANQIVSLAKAISLLPESVAQQLGTIDVLLDFLGVANDPLRERYRTAVEKCRPPIHHLAQRSHGLIILRWLLHRILPHTTFLLDELNLAARLAVTPDSLHSELAGGETLARQLELFKYKGPLHDFDGYRWWRDGIEQWLWEITNGNSADPAAVLSAIDEAGPHQLRSVGYNRAVATMDHELRRERELAPLDQVIPIYLDDWPSYAEPAFARKLTLEQHPEMRMYMSGSDE